MKLNIKIRDLAFRPILFLWLFIHVSSLHANVVTTVSLTGGNEIATYLNGDNTLTISIVLNNTSTAHLTNYASGTIIPYIVWVENGSSAPAFDGDYGNATAWNAYVSNISASGTCTISIPASAFLNTGNNSPQNDWFDLQLLMSKSGQSDVNIAINWGAPHNRNYLTFDSDDPAEGSPMSSPVRT